MSGDDTSRFSRRKLLGSVATIGAAGAIGGASTTALLWDEEKFGNESDPNVLQAGELDLKVDWEGTYYNWLDNPSFSSDGLVDQPGPIINLQDVKPGDVLEVTQSAHVFGNPAFLGWHYQEHADSDNRPDPDEDGEGEMVEPEDKVNGHDPDNSDGPDDGDLDEYMYVVLWYDDGDNIPGEIWTGETELPDGTEDSPDDTLDASTQHDYVMEVGAAQSPSDVFDTEAAAFAGTLSALDGINVRFNAQNSLAGSVADDFPDSWCYQNSDTEYIGAIAWVPRDIPGVNDNIIQTDRLEFQFGFDAIQCRHNVANDGGPIDATISDADAENNANSPE